MPGPLPPRLRPRWRSKLRAARLATLLSVTIAFILILSPRGCWASNVLPPPLPPPPDDHEHHHRLAMSDMSIFPPPGGGAAGLMGGSVAGLGGLAMSWVDQALGRRTEVVTGLANGDAHEDGLKWNETKYYWLDSSQIFAKKLVKNGEELRRRETVDERANSPKLLHITINTCFSPQANSSAPSQPSGVPPQLEVYVSNSSSNQAPGPQVTSRPQVVLQVDQGFGQLDLNVTGDVWIGVHAPAMNPLENGLWDASAWDYEIAASTDEPYHGYNDDHFLYLVDTDSWTALFITGNMTSTSADEGGVDETEDNETLMNSSPPYTMFAQNQNFTAPFAGLEKSYCALRKYATVRPVGNDTSMTTRGLGNYPKQQFHIKSLNRSSTYLGYLARPKANSTSGTLWNPVRFDTKADGNCQIIYNLPFCSEVAYAVPSNPTVFSGDELTTWYDNNTQSWWQNFTYSLQQVQCNATSSAQYSLVRNCDDCASAYKNWLCAVTIPRCMDYSSDLSYLASRSSNTLFYNASTNASQLHPYSPPLDQQEQDEFYKNASLVAKLVGGVAVQSRNPLIDQVIKPGEYKEIRPCNDLCWSLVQSCSSGFGFNCPAMGSWGESVSYGERSDDGDVTCSYLGAVYFLNAASSLASPWVWTTVVVGWTLWWGL